MSITREEKTENFRKGLMDVSDLKIPTYCSKCGGVMIFKGVGEYKCEDCGNVEYDNYGKVRNYIEKNPGTTSAQVSMATGVSQKSIREMLRDQRIEIAPNSNAFLVCEICGANIRYGRYCSKCETAYHRDIEERARAGKHHKMTGFSTEINKGEAGAKRFNWDL